MGFPASRIGAAFANVSIVISAQTQDKRLKQSGWDGVNLRWLGQLCPPGFLMIRILTICRNVPSFYLSQIRYQFGCGKGFVLAAKML